MIQIKNGFKQFKEQVIFNDLNLSIQNNGIHVICGESGSGKTTLLNIIAGFESLTKGDIKTDGAITTIFQNYELIDELNVKENVYLYSKLKNKNNVSYEKEIIELLGLAELFDHYPRELSGGQKQRVGIARALLQEPSIILCDEPTESLDIDNKIKVMELLKTISKSCIVILVTHDKDIINNYYDVCYEIVDKSLITKFRNTTEQNVIKSNNSSLNSTVLLKTISKIVRKRTIVISLLMSIMMIALCCLIAFENYIFTNGNELNAVTKDVIYLESEENLLHLDENVTPILKITSFSCDNKTYRTKIYPTTIDKIEEFLIKGKTSDNLEVVVNQVLADSLGKNVLDKAIELKYTIDNVNYDVETKIVGIVSEDLETPMMYYIQKNYEEYLKLQFTEDGEILYDVFLKKNKFYEYNTAFNNINRIIKKFEDYNVEIISPLYDQCMQEKQDKTLFYYLFKFIEGFILTFIIISIYVVTKRDITKLTKSFSIIASSNISMKKIKQAYIFIKIFINLMITSAFMMLILFTINYFQLLSKEILFISFLLILNPMLTFIFIYQIKKHDINTILKNNLDN